MSTKKELIKAARLALKEGDFRACLVKCKELINEDALSYDAYLMIGKAAFCLEEHEQSEAAYTQATNIEPSNPQAWQGLTELHGCTADWPGLVRALEQLVALLATDPALQSKTQSLRRKLADAYMKIGTREALSKAEAILRGLVIEDEPDLSLLCSLADVQLQLEGADATKNLGDIICLTPPSPSYTKYWDAMLRIKLAANDPSANDLASQMIQHGCSPLASEVVLLSYDLKEIPSRLVAHQAHRFPDTCASQLHLVLILLKEKRSITDSMALRLDICLSLDPPIKSVAGHIAIAFLKIRGNLSSEALTFSKKGLTLLNESGTGGDGARESAKSLLQLFSGRSLVALGRFQEAEVLLSQLKPYTPSCDLLKDMGLSSYPVNIHSQTTRFLLKAKQGRGDLESSHKMIESMIADPSTGSHPSFAWLRAEMGHNLLMAGDLDASRSNLEAAVAVEKEAELMGLEPSEDFQMHRVWLAQVYQGLGGEFATAKGQWAHEQLMTAAAVEGPHLPLAFSRLGYWYETAADGTRATKCYQRSLALDPTLSEAGEGLARLLVVNGELDKAMAMIKQAMESVSDPPQWALRCLGHLQLKSALDPANDAEMRDAAAAVSIATFQNALRSEPSRADLWEGLGEAYRCRGRQTAALKAFSRALELDHTRFHSALSAAALQHQLGSATESQALYSHALSLIPHDPSALLGAAEARLSSAQVKMWSGMTGSADQDLSYAERLAFTAIDQSASSDEVRPKEAAWKLIGDAQLLHSAVSPSKQVMTAGAARAALMTRATFAQQARRSYSHLLHLSPSLSGTWGDLATSCQQEAQLLLLASPPPLPPGIISKSKAISPQQLSRLGQKLVRGGLVIDPSNDSLWSCAGSQHAFAMQLDKDGMERNAAAAEYCYSRALELNSRRAGTWALLGKLYSGFVSRGEGGPGALASKCFEMARSHQPTLPQTWEAMAYLASQAKSIDREHVTELHRHALGLGGGIESRLACVADDLGSENGRSLSGPSVATALRCIRQVPTLPAAHTLLGLALEARGGEDLPRAVEAHEAALTLVSDPTFSNLLFKTVSTGLPAAAGADNATSVPSQAMRINLARCLSKLATCQPTVLSTAASKSAADRSLFLFESLEKDGALQSNPLAWVAYANALRLSKPDQRDRVVKLLESSISASSSVEATPKIQLLASLALCQELVRQGLWTRAYESVKSVTSVVPSDGPDTASLSLSMWLLLAGSTGCMAANSPIPLGVLREDTLAWAEANKAHLDTAQVCASLDSIGALELLASDPKQVGRAMRLQARSVHICPWDQPTRRKLALIASRSPCHYLAASRLVKGRDSLKHPPTSLRDVGVSYLIMSGALTASVVDSGISQIKLLVKSYPDSYVSWLLLALGFMKKAEGSSSGSSLSSGQYLRAKAACRVALRKARQAHDKEKSRATVQVASQVRPSLPPALRLRGNPQVPAAAEPASVDTDLVLVILLLNVALRECHARSDEKEQAQELETEAQEWCHLNSLDPKLARPVVINELLCRAVKLLENQGQTAEVRSLDEDQLPLGARPAALALKSLACLNMRGETSDTNASKRIVLESRYLSTTGIILLKQMAGIDGGRDAALLRCILAEAESLRGKPEKAREEMNRVPPDVTRMFEDFRNDRP